MNRFSLKKVNYRTAVLCNVPLFLIPLVALLFWHLGAYSNDDGYDVTRIVIYIGGLYILPTFVLSAVYLLRAKRNWKKTGNDSARASAVYGLLASIILGGWLLLMEPTW